MIVGVAALWCKPVQAQDLHSKNIGRLFVPSAQNGRLLLLLLLLLRLLLLLLPLLLLLLLLLLPLALPISVVRLPLEIARITMPETLQKKLAPRTLSPEAWNIDVVKARCGRDSCTKDHEGLLFKLPRQALIQGRIAKQLESVCSLHFEELHSVLGSKPT